MTSKDVTLYICDHCNKKYQRKHACIAHEELCYHNPANRRPCLDCNHLVKRKNEAEQDWMHPNGEPATMMVEALYCAKLEHHLHSPQTEAKGNAFDFTDEAENKPMPKECESFSDLFEELPWP